MKIDHAKLEETLDKLLQETNGLCTSTAVCIGVIDGKQVKLQVVNEDEDMEASTHVNKKWECVTKMSQEQQQYGWRQNSPHDQLTAIRSAMEGHLSNWERGIIPAWKYLQYTQELLDSVAALEPYLKGEKNWDKCLCTCNDETLRLNGCQCGYGRA